jgi:anti-anti-sigma regulatory factor
MAIPFSIQVTKPRPDLWVVELSGEHDITTSGDLRARLREPVESASDVIIDLAATTFIDSTVLAEIVLARQRVDRTPSRRLVLVVPSDSPAASLLAIADADGHLFTTFESRTAGLESFDR